MGRGLDFHLDHEQLFAFLEAEIKENKFLVATQGRKVRGTEQLQLGLD